jgi:hypothetical protein
VCRSKKKQYKNLYIAKNKLQLDKFIVCKTQHYYFTLFIFLLSFSVKAQVYLLPNTEFYIAENTTTNIISVKDSSVVVHISPNTKISNYQLISTSQLEEEIVEKQLPNSSFLSKNNTDIKDTISVKEFVFEKFKADTKPKIRQAEIKILFNDCKSLEDCFKTKFITSTLSSSNRVENKVELLNTYSVFDLQQLKSKLKLEKLNHTTSYVKTWQVNQLQNRPPPFNFIS